MKHRRVNKTLGRTKAKREALFNQLGRDLLRHGHVRTTEPKAKELKRYFEPLVSKAKKERTLARYRGLIAELHDKEAVEQLYSVAKENAKRDGGYLRLTKLPSNRHDRAALARVDIIDYPK